MNKKTDSKMVTKNKVQTCSTPEQHQRSPPRDDDSLCGSEAESPVPFLCTQDGTEGETDVVWNFYTPKLDQAPPSRIKNSTPLSRKAKKVKPTLPDKVLPKRKAAKPSQKANEIFQDLIELNQNLNDFIVKKSQIIKDRRSSGSEEDIFINSGESPKSVRNNSKCLRRNLLTSRFTKTEAETALESDDSMNECLIKASQVVEEKILSKPSPAKRVCIDHNETLKAVKPGLNFKIDQNSMDAILNSISLDTPVSKAKKNCDSPCINNDSFDNIFGNLNDSTLEKLTQMPVKSDVLNRSNVNNSKEYADWTVQELVVHDGSPASKTLFGRHNTMPESPSVEKLNKPSTSGMVFGRHNSMPVNDKDPCQGDSPIRCTADEIKRKHQQAREKLLAKRLLPFTSSQNSQSMEPVKNIKKNFQFQPKVPLTRPVNKQISSSTNRIVNTSNSNQQNITFKKESEKASSNSEDIKTLIERKRQEALMRLRKRQPQK